MSNWLDDLLQKAQGAVTALQSGTAKPLRKKWNFIGATIADNPTEERLDITFAGATASSALPQNVGTAAAGAGTAYSRDDHVHAHGNQAGGSLHAVVTDSVAGFMSAADKTRLDGIAPFDGDPAILVAFDGDQTAGVEVQYARGDHSHPHEGQPGGYLHAAVVSGGDNGFMTGADKAILDGMATVIPLADSALSAPSSGIKLGSARQLIVRTTEGVQHEASCQDLASGATSKHIYNRVARLTSTTVSATQDADLIVAADLPSGSPKWVARAVVEWAAYDTTDDTIAGGTRRATIKCVSGTITVATALANQVAGTDDNTTSASVSSGAAIGLVTASGKIQIRFATLKTNNIRFFCRVVDLTLVEH